MGRTQPGRENVLRNYQNVPKFKLETGETARIILLEFGPAKPGEAFGSWSEWRHNFKIPGVVETMADGSKREIKPERFLGNYICLGDEEILAQKLYDPENCPACALADESDEFKPLRYHATNVIRYATKPGTHTVREPWSVECIPWVFGERTFRTVSDLYEEWGDLRKKDIGLKCTVAQYQNFDFSVLAEAVWLAPALNKPPFKYGMAFRELVAQTFKEGKLPDEDLAQLIANRAAKGTLAAKANDLAVAIGISGRSQMEDQPLPSGTMSADDVAAILGGQEVPETVAETASNGDATPEGDESPAVVSEPEAPAETDLDALLA